MGEPITASWYLYTRGQVLDLDTLKYPSLKGFWKEDIEIATHLNFQPSFFQGVPHRRALLASYALFPLREGKAQIDPYRAKATIVGGGRFHFSKKLSSTQESQSLSIQVRPLPKEGQPRDFHGGVGDFQLRLELSDKQVVAGQPFRLFLRVDGLGLAKRIDFPDLPLPEGVEVYDKKVETQFF